MSELAQKPTAPDLLAYLSLTGENYPVEQAQEAIDVALFSQASVCVVDPYTPPLREAALRRGARILSARGAPLGAMDLGEYGASPLIRWDALIEEHEAAYRTGAFS